MRLLRDVFDLTIEGITGFVYPKAENSEDVVFIDKLLITNLKKVMKLVNLN